MNYEEIHELLDRYWDGETTLEEERRIKAYFRSGPIDERLRSVAPMFEALSQEQAVQLSVKAKAMPMRLKRGHLQIMGMAASVAMLIGLAWWMLREQEASSPLAVQIPTDQTSAVVVENPVGAPPKYTIVLAEKPVKKPALPKKKNTPKQASRSEEIDPETVLAMAEIKAALSLVSSKMDKGRIQASKGAAHLEGINKVSRKKDG